MFNEVHSTTQRTLRVETTLWSASFNTIWNDFSYPEIKVDINTDDLQKSRSRDLAPRHGGYG